MIIKLSCRFENVAVLKKVVQKKFDILNKKKTTHLKGGYLEEYMAKNIKKVMYEGLNIKYTKI